MRARRAAALLVAVLLGGLLTGCAAAVDERPLVVVTTNILGDIVENLAGDDVEVVTLMRPDADPHSFEISAQESALMLRADLLVSNGLGLEEGLQQHLDTSAAAGVAQFVAGDEIETLDYSSGSPDPHFWTDPGRVIRVVGALGEALAQHVPSADQERVREHVASYTEQLRELDAMMSDSFAGIPVDRRQLVTNHHVFGYLADRYGFTVLGAVIPGGTTLAAPSASDLRDLVAVIEEAGVPTIFAESSQPDRLIQVLAEEAGIRVRVVELYTESLTAPGGGADSYLAMMRENTDRITQGLAD